MSTSLLADNPQGHVEAITLGLANIATEVILPELWERVTVRFEDEELSSCERVLDARDLPHSVEPESPGVAQLIDHRRRTTGGVVHVRNR